MTMLKQLMPCSTMISALVLLIFMSAARAFSPPNFAVSRTAISSRRSFSPAPLNLVSLNVASAMADLDTFWQTSPYTAAAIACGFKASAADMVAQQNPPAVLELEEEQEEVEPFFIPFASSQALEVEAVVEEDVASTDYKRNVAFLLYGSLYQGMSQEYIYNHLYPVWFGAGNEVTVVLTKVAFDLLVQTTLVTLPMAYLIKGVIYGNSPLESIQKYGTDVKHQQLLQKYFLLWGPVQVCTFGIVPEHYRVTFIAFVSFFWLIILSRLSSQEAVITQEE